MSNTLRIIARQADESIAAAVDALALHPAAKRVLANRASKFQIEPSWLLDIALNKLDNPGTLPDVDVAANRIVDAIINQEIIGLETDHDVDGVTSHAVIYSALHDFFGHPQQLLRSYIGHRIREGYGLSDALCDRILAEPARCSLIITADNGSSDEPRIARLKAEGIDTVVTDHHGMPETGTPASALACVSPARPDSKYPDPLIAGVMVSFLLMCVVRQKLVERGHIDTSAPRLSALLDYVAAGTVADCVSLSRSRNNRIVIQNGLSLINAAHRPCWQVLKSMFISEGKPVNSMDLGFQLGPRINAAGRLDDAMVGVKFLLAKSQQEAFERLQELDESNKLRREIEGELKEEAMIVGEAQVEAGRTVVQVVLMEGHAGVHGIVASRLVEKFGRPAVCFSEKYGLPDVLTGSARGIEGMHVREAMQKVSDAHPGLIKAFGGHEGAGGITIDRENFTTFEAAYETAIKEQLAGANLGPVLMTDGLLPSSDISLEMMAGLEQIEPFGREFDSPVFSSVFKLINAKPVGKEGIHWKLSLAGREGGIFGAIWFHAGTQCPIDMNGMYRLSFSPDLNWWKGKCQLQLIIRAAEPDVDLPDANG